MKNKVWFFLLIVLFGSAASLSVLANDDPSAFPGGEVEISNDEATTDREHAREAVQTCSSDCRTEETKSCNDRRNITGQKGFHKCLSNVVSFCARKCD